MAGESNGTCNCMLNNLITEVQKESINEWGGGGGGKFVYFVEFIG